MSNDVDDEFDRMQETIDSLRAENARLNKENDDWHEASKKLREEAQTARLALDVADKEVAALRARVAELEAPDPRLGTLWQAIDDAMAAGEGPVRWSALERIESAAYVIRTE